MNGIAQIKQLLISRVSEKPPDAAEINKMVEKITKSATSEYHYYCFSAAPDNNQHLLHWTTYCTD